MVSFKFVTGAFVGASAMYFFDPQLGRRRRVQKTDQLRSRVRQLRRDAERRNRYEAQRREGEQHERASADRVRSADDRTVADHLRQVLASLGVPTRDVTVEVADGTVRLRGQVPTASDIDRVIYAVEHQAGVKQVESFLHLPGQPAPNKETSLARGTTASRRPRQPDRERTRQA